MLRAEQGNHRPSTRCTKTSSRASITPSLFCQSCTYTTMTELTSGQRVPPSPIPPVVILFVRLGSQLTSRMAGRSNTPRPSRTTSRPGRPSFIIAHERSFRSTRADRIKI